MVIHRDRSAIVINKPPGLATQGGTKTTDHVDRLLDGLLFDAPSRPKLVHRLDKDTSGAIGRASGRARVCQHVENYVVGGTLKKKKKEMIKRERCGTKKQQ